MSIPPNEEWERHPGAACMVFDEGTFWTDEQPAYEIARLTASIEQVAKWHENSGQRAIIEDCKRIRALLKGVTA